MRDEGFECKIVNNIVVLLNTVKVIRVFRVKSVILLFVNYVIQ